MMLIGLNVISGSCISKLIGRKFTFFLCYHFPSIPLFSLWLKTFTFTWPACVNHNSHLCQIFFCYTCERKKTSKMIQTEIFSQYFLSAKNPPKSAENLKPFSVNFSKSTKCMSYLRFVFYIRPLKILQSTF